MKERNPDKNLDFFFYFAIKDGEITLIRQKKRIILLFCSHLFVNLQHGQKAT